MTTNHHTPYVAHVTAFRASEMNAPLQQLDAALTDLAASSGGDVSGPATNTDNYVPQWDGADSKTLKAGFAITTAGKALIDDTDAVSQRATLGLDAAGISLSYQSGDKPAAGVSVRVILPYALTLPANLTGSGYFAETGPAAEAVVSIKKNGSEFATLTVAIGATSTGTWAGSQTAFAAGDRVTFTFPASQDAAWSGVSIMLKGERS